MIGDRLVGPRYHFRHKMTNRWTTWSIVIDFDTISFADALGPLMILQQLVTPKDKGDSMEWWWAINLVGSR